MKALKLLIHEYNKPLIYSNLAYVPFFSLIDQLESFVHGSFEISQGEKIFVFLYLLHD